MGWTYRDSALTPGTAGIAVRTWYVVPSGRFGNPGFAPRIPLAHIIQNNQSSRANLSQIGKNSQVVATIEGIRSYIPRAGEAEQGIAARHGPFTNGGKDGDTVTSFLDGHASGVSTDWMYGATNFEAQATQLSKDAIFDLWWATN